jgi:hypothetical protein
VPEFILSDSDLIGGVVKESPLRAKTGNGSGTGVSSQKCGSTQIQRAADNAHDLHTVDKNRLLTAILFCGDLVFRNSGVSPCLTDFRHPDFYSFLPEKTKITPVLPYRLREKPYTILSLAFFLPDTAQGSFR